MAKKALGIYLGNTIVSGVVTERQGKGIVCHSQADVVVSQSSELADCLQQLLDKLEWEGGECNCGIPLSWLSTRNLDFPFADRKKIEQTLLHELDDHLIDPIDEVAVSYNVVSRDGGQSKLLAFSVEKEQLHSFLSALNVVGLDPDRVSPAVVPLSEVVGKNYPDNKTIVLQAGLSSLTMALVVNGTCLFCRELPYPEDFLNYSASDFIGLIMLPSGDDFFQKIGEDFKRNLGFMRLNGVAHVDDLQQVVGTGLLAGHPAICHKLSSKIGKKVEPSTMQLIPELTGREIFMGVRPLRYEMALSLSLLSWEKYPTAINFRQGAFKKKRILFTSRKQIFYAASILFLIPFLAAFYCWNDYRVLSDKNQSLQASMETLYRSQFPEAGRIQNAYTQMKVAVRGKGDAEFSLPFFSGRPKKLDMLADISSRIPGSLPLEISRMVLEQESVRMRGETENYNSVNEIKRLLSGSSFYSNVQILSATSAPKSGKIRFEIQLELGGD